jgi:hypothetical protein
MKIRLRKPGFLGGLLFAAMLIGLVCPSGASVAVAAPAACNAGPPLPPIDKIRGIRTKWLSLRPDARNSVQPDLAHLTLGEWMRNLEKIGVNIAEINLEPRRKLLRAVLSPTALQATIDAIYTPASQRTPAQRERMALYENQIAPHWEYTPQQRDDILLDFLRRLEALRRKGEIAGTVRFIIHQRLWFRQGDRPRLVYMRGQRLREFVDDMTTFIRRADSECLGHWIAGVRLGEHSNTDMSELLPLIVDIARAINAQTGGWLKSHLLTVNGGGWGANYRGIDHVVGPDDAPFPFFADIARETAEFTFGYKFMQFHKPYAGITGHMAAAFCGPYRYCNISSVADWDEYLGQILGLEELISYLNANHQRYPAYANVVFVGDSSDSIAELVEAEPGDRLVDTSAMVALRHLFVEAGPVAASGKIFMNGYNTAANWRKPIEFNGGGRAVDVGRALYFVDQAGKGQLLTQSYRLWKDWPRPDAQSTGR